VQVVRLTAR